MTESRSGRRKARRDNLTVEDGMPDTVAQQAFDKVLRLEGKVGSLMDRVQMIYDQLPTLTSYAKEIGESDDTLETLHDRLQALEKILLFVDMGKLNSNIDAASKYLVSNIDPAICFPGGYESVNTPLKLELHKLLSPDEFNPTDITTPVKRVCGPALKHRSGIEQFDISLADESYDGFFEFTGANDCEYATPSTTCAAAPLGEDTNSSDAISTRGSESDDEQADDSERDFYKAGDEQGALMKMMMSMNAKLDQVTDKMHKIDEVNTKLQEHVDDDVVWKTRFIKKLAALEEFKSQVEKGQVSQVNSMDCADAAGQIEDWRLTSTTSRVRAPCENKSELNLHILTAFSDGEDRAVRN